MFLDRRRVSANSDFATVWRQYVIEHLCLFLLLLSTFQLTVCMKAKLLNALLILTSLMGYLSWGKDKHLFLFQAEADIFSKLFDNPLSVIHPFTILPLSGQVMLLITLFQQKPSKVLTFISIGALGMLLGLMLVIGLISLNYRIVLSTIPFLATSVVTIRYHRLKKHTA